MSLQDLEFMMRRCTRCSYCKFIPVIKQDNRDYETCCPSIARYNFHAYAGSGKLIVAQALLQDRIDYSDGLLDVIYRCNVDGACDISCKNQSDLEPLQAMLELRAKCVEDGQLLREHMLVIEGLKKEDNMMMKPKTERGNWAKDLDVKDLTAEKADILFHAGCRFSLDEELWPIARGAVKLMKKAGLDVGIMGASEACCGGRAYEWGYQGEHIKYADHNVENWKTTGVRTIVTPCADCYHAFKVLYDKIDKKPGIEILHTSEYFARMVREDKLSLTKEIPETVTYHDPCHLGRLGEPWIHWDGIETVVAEGGLAGLVIQDPPKVFRRGANGVYDPPRDIIRSIPGIKFVEMERIREYAWCCGAGGGVLEVYPDFAEWTAIERINEAKSTGADAIVTACPWCERVLKDALKKNGAGMKVYDIVELIERATEREG